MKYYILFSEDGESVEGNFEAHNTLEEAERVAQEYAKSDSLRSDDDYFIRATEPDTYPEKIIDYDIYGKEI